jgi:hypothetical protein
MCHLSVSFTTKSLWHFLPYTVFFITLNSFITAQDIVVAFANLNFITDRLGLANDFQAYQSTLAAAVTFLKTDSQVGYLNNLMRDSFREYCKTSSFFHFCYFINTPAYEIYHPQLSQNTAQTAHSLSLPFSRQGFYSLWTFWNKS